MLTVAAAKMWLRRKQIFNFNAKSSLANNKHKFIGHYTLENLSEIAEIEYKDLLRYFKATVWI